MGKQKKAQVAAKVTSNSYTAKEAEDAERKSIRKATKTMPINRLHDGIFSLLSVLYAPTAFVILFLLSAILFPFLVIFILLPFPGPVYKAKKPALKALFARACAAQAGFGPDDISIKLLSQSSLMPEVPIIGKMFTKFYFYSNLLGFYITKRFYIEQLLGLTLGRKVRFHDITYLQMRTCWLDDVIRAFLTENKNSDVQIVILGAGFDTRFLRIEMGGNVKRFEISDLGTQNLKLKYFDNLSIDYGAKDIAYISCESEPEGWGEKLSGNGWKKDIPTCFLWEGQSVYAERAQVKRTLDFISNNCCKGSMIAFDYMDLQWVNLIAPLMKSQEEKYRFGMFKGEATSMAKEYNLNLLDHLEYEELLKRYLPEDVDGDTRGVCIDFGGFALLGKK